MTRELILLRHGKAESGAGGGDRRRALTERGLRDAARAGLWLRREGLSPDHVVSSTAIRAFATAEAACRALGVSEDAIVQDARIYEAGTETLLTVIRELPPAGRRVLLVGHNPGFESLAEALSGRPAKLRTADLACLRLEGAWRDAAPGAAVLERLVRAADLS
ncbi:MAG: histidine phosphatase family protein [Alphaproteobacteria bacterium]|nr:histidine phosphatase family protein [Alphaproteobacteria bacterium]